MKKKVSYNKEENTVTVNIKLDSTNELFQLRKVLIHRAKKEAEEAGYEIGNVLTNDSLSFLRPDKLEATWVFSVRSLPEGMKKKAVIPSKPVRRKSVKKVKKDDEVPF